jgi:hypothetical protein
MTAKHELDTTIENLEPMIARGQFNKALRELTAAFEKRLEAGEIDEARLLVGMATRAARGREPRRL